jgi:YbbR domain-containing protein
MRDLVSVAGIQRAFTRNWTLKVSALGVAVLLWFSVRFEARNQQEISNVAVRVDLSDPDWVVGAGAEPQSVAVRFRGPALELLRLSSDRPVVVVPVTDVTGSDSTFVIQPGWVRFGERPGVVVEGINPASVTFRFEPVARVTLPGALGLTGELPEGLALAAAPRPSVNDFRVSGPRNLTAGLDSIPLGPVALGGITQSGSVPVLVDTARVSGVQVQPIALDVDFQVGPRVERQVEVAVPPLPEAYRGEGFPDRLTLTLSGAASLVEAVDPGALTLVLELPDTLDPDWERYEVGILVEGLSPLLAVQIDPIEVRREDP